MKNGRWFAPFGSIVLFASAIFHSSGYIPLLRRMHAVAIEPPFDGFIKASWWILAVEFAALGVIALLAHSQDRGGRIVLLCAATAGVTAALLFCFMGLFPGVYLLAIVTVLYAIGGWLQAKQRPTA
jgi:CHASE2 domain-containing sensor protein